MQDAIASLRSLLTSPGDNLAALGTLIAIFVTATIILVLLIIAFVLPGASEEEDEAEEPAEEPVALPAEEPGLGAEHEPEPAAPARRKRPGGGAAGCATSIVILFAGSVAAFSFWYATTSSNDYCGTTCHEMLEPANTHGASAHADVTCVRCHEGPQWRNLDRAIVRRGRYLYAAATGTSVRRMAFDESTCVDCHRDVVNGEITTRAGQPFLHGDVLEPGARCGECHDQQGHVPPR